MTWTWTSNFPKKQGFWAAGDTGYGDLALYTAGTGWVSVDNQSAGATYDRVIRIDYSGSAFTMDTVSINYNYEKGSFASSSTNAIQIFTDTGSQTITAANTSDGDNQTLTLSATGSTSVIIILVRSSSNSSAVYSGIPELNSVTITGPDPNPFEDYKVIPSAGALANGGLASSFSPNQNGQYLFFAVEDSSGNQQVIKANKPTSTTPVLFTAYNSASGTSGNIAPTGDPDRMFFHGNFGTDVGVIDHAIAAATNTDISPASVGAKLIQPLRADPADIKHIIAINRDDQDAIETVDTGSNWSTLNATLGQDVDAMDVQFFGPYFLDAAFFGGNDGTDENLEFTPNEFADFREDTSAALKAVGSIVSIDRVSDIV